MNTFLAIKKITDHEHSMRKYLGRGFDFDGHIHKLNDICESNNLSIFDAMKKIERIVSREGFVNYDSIL